jgi:predicted TIM-barrel fold metal-dependent hydrolase
VDRRTFLAGTLSLSTATGATDSIPIIDSHIHLFDPTRPQGVPWPSKDNAILYKTALTGRYRSLAVPLGITGAIEIECSPWLEDNQWVLDIAAKDGVIVGTVGHLEPGTPHFSEQLDRFHKNPLFRGIRCGNLWGSDIGPELNKARFISDLKRLSGANLELDVANPTAELIADVVRLTDAVPDLRVVIDHLPRMEPPADAQVRKECDANLRRLGERTQVFAKMSGVLRRVEGQVPLDLAFYRPTLDRLWETFGEDRIVYGSDWPNSDLWGPYPQALRIVREYLAGKGRSAAEKVLWKNSCAAYRWIRRDAAQPKPSLA